MLISTKTFLLNQYAKKERKRISYTTIAKELLPHYIPGDFRDGEKRIQFNKDLEELRDAGYIRLNLADKKSGTTVYNIVFTEKMEELCRTHGHETPHTKELSVKRAIMAAGDLSGIVKQFAENQIKSIDAGSGYSRKVFGTGMSEKDITDSLVGASAVLQNKENILYRDFSQSIFNHSKRLGEIHNKIGIIIRHCKKEYEGIDLPAEKQYPTKALLKDYAIFQTPYPILFQCDAELILLNGKSIDTCGMPYSFMSNFSDQYQHIHLHKKEFITIENKTTYADFCLNDPDPEQGKFFTSGFPGKAEKELLRKIYQDNPCVQFFHWGDLDCGGFEIFRNIKSIMPTLKPMHMDIDDLRKLQETNKTIPLTEKDRERLKKILSSSDSDLYMFKPVIKEMLHYNCKCEQEAFFS